MTVARLTPPGLLQRGVRLFASAADEPRSRRASDVVLLVGSLVGLALVGVAAFPTPAMADALSRLLDAFPSFVDNLWQILSDLLVLFAGLLLVATLVRRRWSLARDQLLTLLVAVLVWWVAGRLTLGAWPALDDSLVADAPPPWYPSSRVALGAGVVLATNPHLARPVRRLGRWLVGGAVLGITALGATTPLGAMAGLLVAAVAASAVHLLVGSSGGRPSLTLVRAALTELGVATEEVSPARLQQAGLFTVDATADDGSNLVVKVYGRDAHDAALLSTLWRTVWFREPGAPLRLGRLQQVEHEAFLTLLAAQAGVATDRVVTAGATVDDDALLVLHRRGLPLGERIDEAIEQSVVAQLWDAVGRLHQAGIAHGQLDETHLLVDGDQLGVVDFRGGAVLTSPFQRHTDEAQALVTATMLVGPEAAAESAAAHLGSDGLAEALPFIQSAALTSTQRRQVRDKAVDLDALRTAAARAAGSEPPPLVRLRRVTARTIVSVALPALAVFALLSVAAGIDLEELAEQLRDASWWLVAVGFVAAQLPRLTQAITTLGASPVPLPLGPVYALQLAVSYINLAIPTSAARVAVNIRFFQRHGVPPGSAMAAGAIDGFAGFVVQATLLVGILMMTPASLDLDIGSAAESAGKIALFVALIGGAAVLLVAAVRRWRRFILGWARRLGSEAWVAIRGLRSPRRLLLLLGGSLATEVLFAVTLATFVLALGYPIGLGEALLINICVGLLAGLLPVPGGIGVTEGGLVFGLVNAGVPEEAALAAVILYRLASFYLPPVWGFFALRWLERNGHI